MSVDDFPHDDPAAREWRRQERARAAELAGAGMHLVPPDERAYRLIARALAHPPAPALPADFAGRVALRAGRVAAEQGGPLEATLLWLLGGFGVVAAAVVLALGNGDWLASFTHGPVGRVVDDPTVLLLAACLAASAAAGRLVHPRAGRATDGSPR